MFATPPANCPYITLQKPKPKWKQTKEVIAKQKWQTVSSVQLQDAADQTNKANGIEANPSPVIPSY